MPKWFRMALAVLAGALVLILAGPGFEERRFSCHKCRSLREVRLRSFFVVKWRTAEEVHTEHPIEQGHVHDWWMYSHYRERGLFGWLGKSVGCKDKRYKTD